MDKYLITFDLCADHQRDFLSFFTTYRPDLTTKGDPSWKTAILKAAPKGIVFLSKDLARVKRLISRDCYHLIMVDTECNTSLEDQISGFGGMQIDICRSSGSEAIEDAFAIIEYKTAKIIADRAATIKPYQKTVNEVETISIIGCGIVNLITGICLQQQGYKISFYDKGPDPDAIDDSPEFGATYGGRNGRIFSFNESRHHLSGPVANGDEGYAQFRYPIGHGGWLFDGPDNIRERDQKWIDELQSVPSWLTRVYDRNIISFNIASYVQWLDMMTGRPELFEGVHLVKKLFRIYQAEESFIRGFKCEKSLGSFIRALSLDDLVKEIPVLSAAVYAGAIHGAAEVKGFSLQVKTFAKNLISNLKAGGAEFSWRSEMTAVMTDSDKKVNAIVVGGREIQSKHYVMSTGASCNPIEGLEHVQSLLASVAGAWLEIPDPSSTLPWPMKVSRRAFASKDAAEGANVIPGRNARGESVIYCSSGHGFLGQGSQSIKPSNLNTLSRCVFETAMELFPSHMSDNRMAEMCDVEFQYCIRPWTSSGLGLFDRIPTSKNGQFIITGGHNTGGFAQSPAVANAVLASLRNETFDMAALYNPYRRCSMIR